ncbi:MAG: response regulator transcription factor [Solirubrobacteraceae bacterium]
MKRLLVVAENSLIVEAIAIGLRKSGEFELLGQVNGETASAESVLQASPDVVLIDELGDSEGMLALIREVKAQRPSVTLLVLTLSAPPEWLDALFAAGATGAVSKATQPGALTTLIRETIDGRVLNLHKPVEADAKAGGPAKVADGLLSARELEVLQLVAAGSTNGDIARKLWVTEQTVKFHLSNIYRKLDVGNRTEASRYAHVNGLVGGGGSQPGG